MRASRIIVSAMGVCLAGALCAGETDDPKPRLAVVDFKAVGRVGIADAGRAVAELLQVRLKADRYRIVERTQLSAILDEHDLSMAEVVSNPHVLRGRKLRGVRYLILGSVVRLGRLAVAARMVDVSSGEIVQTAEVSAQNAEDLGAGLARLAALLQMSSREQREYRGALARPGRPAESEARSPGRVKSLRTAQAPAGQDAAHLPAESAANRSTAPTRATFSRHILRRTWTGSTFSLRREVRQLWAEVRLFQRRLCTPEADLCSRPADTTDCGVLLARLRALEATRESLLDKLDAGARSAITTPPPSARKNTTTPDRPPRVAAERSAKSRGRAHGRRRIVRSSGPKVSSPRRRRSLCSKGPRSRPRRGRMILAPCGRRIATLASLPLGRRR